MPRLETGMARRRPATLSRRALVRLGLVGIGGLLAAVAGCQSSRPGAAAPAAPAAWTAELYRAPTCECCGQYAAYLEEAGVTVQVRDVDDIAAVKREWGVPQAVWSCHTMRVGPYFVEGHVPLAAIERLLAERPAVDGIALPGMPAGSPGMGGQKAGPFVISAVADGVVTEYMKL